MKTASNKKVHYPTDNTYSRDNSTLVPRTKIYPELDVTIKEAKLNSAKKNSRRESSPHKSRNSSANRTGGSLI